MYKLYEGKKISVASEIRAMTEFVTERWSSVQNVEQLFQRVAKDAKKAVGYSVDERVLTRHIGQQAVDRRIVLAGFRHPQDVEFYDQAYLLLQNMERKVRRLEETAGDTSTKVYLETLRNIKLNLPTELKHLKRAQPKGLRKMLAHYEAHDEAWDQALSNESEDRDCFQGADTGNACGGGFDSTVSITQVLQNKVHHDVAPIDELIEGAYKHLFRIYQAINTQSVCADLTLLKPYILSKQPVFKLDFSPKHKVTKILEGFAREAWLGAKEESAEHDYLESQNLRKEKKPLSPQEKLVAEETARVQIKGLWDRIVNTSKSN